MEDRYSRQILFKEISAEGQEKLARARVVIVGCGATGSILASLLARAGIGALVILDRDYVEPSNLQRQSLFDENDARDFPSPKQLRPSAKSLALILRSSSNLMSPTSHHRISIPCSATPILFSMAQTISKRAI